MSAGEDRRERLARSRGEILAAAATLFAQRGYHGLGMRELARATGQSLANLYNYFTSKDELLFAVQTSAFETLLASAGLAIAAAEEPESRLHAFVLNHLRYVAAHREVMRVLVEEAGELPVERRKIVRELKERYFRLGFGLVRELVAEGCGAPGAAGLGCGKDGPTEAELERATYSVFGMLNWVYGWYDPERHGSAEDVARTIHGVALCGLVARCPNRALQRTLEGRVAGLELVAPLRALADGGAR